MPNRLQWDLLPYQFSDPFKGWAEWVYDSLSQTLAAMQGSEIVPLPENISQEELNFRLRMLHDAVMAASLVYRRPLGVGDEEEGDHTL